MRISRDVWAMLLAKVTAQRSTCLRRSVGCVLLDARGFVLSTGVNGVATGLPHCNEVGNMYEAMVDRFPHACPGAHAPSGQNLDACQAIHAEQNALLQCRDVHSIHTCYVTASPCVTCVKLLMNTSCERILFLELYPHKEAETMWRESNERRSWLKMELPG